MAAPDIKRFTIVTGHYGSGKTNLSINLALDQVERYGQATLVDLDVVNPYFRSSDYASMLGERGVRVISPNFAGTTLDVPSLSPAVGSAFRAEGAVIFDVGGDDVGATALGRFAQDVRSVDHDFLYVVNAYRTLTATPEEAAEVLHEIEHASHLKATGVVNNSHLRELTDAQTVLDSLEYAQQTAAHLGLPLRFTTVPKRISGEFSTLPAHAAHVENAYPIDVYVKTPWESDPEGDEEVGH